MSAEPTVPEQMELPVLPVRGAVIFPGSVLPIPLAAAEHGQAAARPPHDP